VQHFLNLDKCTCGAYRYLAVREHKRSYEVYLIHHSHLPNSQDQRKYSKLASIPKYRLNFHDQRQNEIGHETTVKITFEQSMALRSLLKELDNAKIESEPVEEEEKLEIAETLST
jgi:hypothetical protein